MLLMILLSMPGPCPTLHIILQATESLAGKEVTNRIVLYPIPGGMVLC